MDTDPHASTYDTITAYDVGVSRVLQYARIRPPDVRDLVHGTIFARDWEELVHSAIFIGGSDVSLAEELLKAVQEAFVGPLRVSVMLDASGCNTTAAAAVTRVLSAGSLASQGAVVLAGTGPVGQRTAALLAHEGAAVTLTSRRLAGADAASRKVQERVGLPVRPAEAADREGVRRALEGARAVVATGAPGVMLLPELVWQQSPALRVLVDANAVPPLGIEGIDATWSGAERGGKLIFGAYGLGDLKKRIHRACLSRLFEQHDLVLDAETILAVAREVEPKCAS